ncbi:MAG: hypothetical protein AB1746_07025 [Candidatus Zixiibacteriota bacterium]
MKNILMFLMAALLLLLAGCYQYEEHLTINDDGSGVLKMHFVMKTDYIREMRAMLNAAEAEAPEDEGETFSMETIFDRAAIEKNLEASNCGLKLTGYNLVETEDTTAWDMEFAVADVNKLYDLNEALYPEESLSGMNNDEEDDDDTEIPAVFSKQENGNWQYLRYLDEVAAANDDEEAGVYDYDYSYDYPADTENYEDMTEEPAYDSDIPYEDSQMVYEKTGDILYDSAMSAMSDDSMQAYMEEFMQMTQDMMECKMRYTVTFPGKIVESNADETNGNTATWEINFKDMNSGIPSMRATIEK